VALEERRHDVGVRAESIVEGQDQIRLRSAPPAVGQRHQAFVVDWLEVPGIEAELSLEVVDPVGGTSW
jgi:hypothetical protein